jgi:hypothetical protein
MYTSRSSVFLREEGRCFSDQQLRDAQAELTAAVQRARTQGHPWNAIGTTLRITRQAAQQQL